MVLGSHVQWLLCVSYSGQCPLLMLKLEQFQFFNLNGRGVGYYSFVWKTIFWSGNSQGMSGNCLPEILNEPCGLHE